MGKRLFLLIKSYNRLGAIMGLWDDDDDDDDD